MNRKRYWSIGVIMLIALAVTPVLMLRGERSLETAGTAHAQTVGATTAMKPKAAMFDKNGELVRPREHREWVFVGAPVTPNDMNDGKAAFPEFHNVYIDPTSYASYKKSGKFPNGTVILKELVSVGSKSMDSGEGYFQGEYLGLEAMVKDTQRFDSEPGGWAFFRFGEAPHYNPTGTRMKTESCNSCHSGADEDYVFTATYPVLRAAKAKIDRK